MPNILQFHNDVPMTEYLYQLLYSGPLHFQRPFIFEEFSAFLDIQNLFHNFISAFLFSLSGNKIMDLLGGFLKDSFLLFYHILSHPLSLSPALLLYMLKGFFSLAIFLFSLNFLYLQLCALGIHSCSLFFVLQKQNYYK